MMNGAQPKSEKDSGTTGSGVAALLGEAENPVGVAQAQRINQEKR